MNNWLHYLLVGVIVAIAVVAAVRSAVGAAKGKKTALTACASCKLKDVCQKPEVILHRYLRKVAWMSGLVTGLQNRAQRFESASDLNEKSPTGTPGWRFSFFVTILPDNAGLLKILYII